MDISVKAGRVDILVRDETGMIYHLEEQRNLKEADLYRFATYHLLVFLPLYGKETGAVRSEMVESLIRFETELFKQERISSDVQQAD